MRLQTMVLLGVGAVLAAVAVSLAPGWLNPPPLTTTAPPPKVATAPAASEPADIKSEEDESKFLPVAGSPPYRAMTQFPVVAAAEGGPHVKAEESVLGVVVGDEARAYPIERMTEIPQEILNDTLGGRPIVVAWCDRCQNGLAYGREVAGRTLTFYITGLTWKDNMVMGDVETNTLWSNLLGQAMRGSLEGTTLEPIPVVVTDWATWRRLHPTTTIAVPRLTIPARAHRDRYERQPAGRFSLTYAVGGRARSWAFERLRKQPVVNDTLGDRPLLVTFERRSNTARLLGRKVANRVLSFRDDGDGRMTDDQTGSRWDPVAGIALDGPMAGTHLRDLSGVVVPDVIWNRFHPYNEGWIDSAT